MDYNNYNKVLTVIAESENNSIVITYDTYSYY